MKMQKSFAHMHIFLKSGAIYVKAKTKWSTDHTHIVYTNHQRKLNFIDICLFFKIVFGLFLKKEEHHFFSS